jgi:hypothetical protein
MHGVASVRPTIRRVGELKKKTGVPKGDGHPIATPTALLKEDSVPPFVAAIEAVYDAALNPLFWPNALKQSRTVLVM